MNPSPYKLVVQADTLRGRLMRHALWLIFLVLPAIIVSAAILQPFVDPRLLMLDAMVAAEESGDCCKTYYGLISTIGVMGWIAAAAICAFSALLLWRLGGTNSTVVFAVFAALFTGMLGVDDAFLFHENLAPKIGIAQNTVIAFYGFLAAVYLWVVWQNRERVKLPIFIVSGFFLAASVGLDVILHSTDSMIVSLEDGAKFIGISCWLGFHVDSMASLIGASVSRETEKRQRPVAGLSGLGPVGTR